MKDESVNIRLVRDSRLPQRYVFYDDVDQFAPISQLFLLRILWIFTLSLGLMFRKQIDIPNAFTGADIERDVFIRLPFPFDKVVKLKKALYGLNDSPKPKLWNSAFSSFLKSLGYESFMLQPCFFFKRVSGRVVSLLLLYVDDLHLLGSFLDTWMEQTRVLR